MSDFGDHLLTLPRKRGIARFRPAFLFLIPLAAILFQVYVPRFIPYLAYLELPLLVTVYFALMRHDPIAGVLFGAVIGLAQDSLSHQPLGMFGIVKTLIGYFAATVSQRFDLDTHALRLALGFFFFCFHQFFYWVLSRMLLGQQIDLDLQQTLLFGLLNAAVGVPLFQILDRLKETG